jgi:hypothetical protein
MVSALFLRCALVRDGEPLMMRFNARPIDVPLEMLMLVSRFGFGLFEVVAALALRLGALVVASGLGAIAFKAGLFRVR